jgi:hypothetical protein
VPADAKRHLRKFGLTVGGALVLLGTISWWRGHQVPPRVLWTLGVLLLVPGLVAPTVLGPVERAWMKFAGVLAYVNTRIILTVVFYVILVPVGAVIRLFSDPLDLALGKGEDSDWIKRERKAVDPDRYRLQF